MKTIRRTTRSRPTHSPLAFSVLAIVSLAVLWSFLFWRSTFVTVGVAACSMATYFALAAISIPFAKSKEVAPEACNSPSIVSVTALHQVVVCYLAILALWHFALYLIFKLTYLSDFWHAPVLGAINIARIEHATLACFSILLLTSYLGRVCLGERFSWLHCLDTAVLLNLVFASHFTIP